MRHAFSIRLLPAVALLTSIAAPAWPQSPDTLTLPPVVVTATRVPIRADLVSASLTVISGDALRAAGVATVADALRAVTSATVVTTGSYGGQTSLFLRGGESDYVKVLVDGVPQNQPGGFFDFAYLGTEDVDRIEIVRGPGSVLYGSDAVAGVVQVFTRSGGPARARVAFGGGTYGTAWGTGDVAGGAGGDATSYRVTISRSTTDGIYRLNNEYRRNLVSARVGLRPDSRTEASLSARYADGVFHFPTDFTGQVADADSDQHTSARGPSLAFQGGRYLAERVEARVSVAYHREEDRFDDGSDSPGDTTVFCCSHSRDVVSRLVAGAWANVHLAAAVFTGGVELEQQRQWGTNLDTARHNAALYAQALAGGGAPSVSLGVRLDDNQRFGRHLTGRLGASWRLDRFTRLRASGGTGFKEPSFFENFPTAFTRGNPALKPEQSTSWELGLDRTLGRLTVSATYFAQRFRDFIQFTPGGASVDFTNIGAAMARGIELTARAASVAGVSLDASYSYLRTRDGDTGDRLLRRPTHSGSLQLGFDKGRANANLSARFTGDRDDQDFAAFPAARVTLPPHTLVDASVAWRVTGPGGIFPGVRLTARVENVLNVEYEEVRHFLTPGRTILVGGTLEVGG